jgi:DNA replication protein DnaC
MSREIPIRSELLQNLTQLHLPAMRACFEDAARRAEKETLSYEQYLLELTERECEARDHNRVAKLLKESSLPLDWRRPWPTSTRSACQSRLAVN